MEEPASGPSIGRNVAINLANVLATVGTTLIAVPIIIDHLTVAGYGLWTLGQSLVLYVTNAEGGLGPAIARFVSLRSADHRHAAPIVWLALGVYAAVGLGVVLFAYVSAPVLVDLFHVPAHFRADAIHMMRLLGWVTLCALISAAFGQALVGLERYPTYTVTSAAGSVVFLVTLAVLLSNHPLLADVAGAGIAQWLTVAALRGAAVFGVLRVARPRFPPRADLRGLMGFSARLQIATLATLLNTQTDRVVIGAISSARTLGQAGVGTQVAEAVRYLAGSALNPLASRMAVTFGHAGLDSLDAVYGEVVRVWRRITIGLTLMLVVVMAPLIEAWLGPGHAQAAVFGAVLTVAYGCNMLTAPAVAYLRAIGRPGTEGAYGVVTVAANLVLTILLGVALGALGVVTATLVAYLVSTAWFFRRVSPMTPTIPRERIAIHARWGLSALFAAAVGLVIARVSVAFLPSGVSLIGVGTAGAVALGLLLVATVGAAPVVAAIRGVRPKVRAKAK